jgi:hypothetical protein
VFGLSFDFRLQQVDCFVECSLVAVDPPGLSREQRVQMQVCPAQALCGAALVREGRRLHHYLEKIPRAMKVILRVFFVK